MSRRLWIFAVLILFPQVGRTQNPTSVEVLPPPQEPSNLLITNSYMSYPGPQIGRRDVWELHAVDYRGRFVPRVVMDPNGAYYLKDGRPYPWTTLNESVYTPFTTTPTPPSPSLPQVVSEEQVFMPYAKEFMPYAKEIMPFARD